MVDRRPAAVAPRPPHPPHPPQLLAALALQQHLSYLPGLLLPLVDQVEARVVVKVVDKVADRVVAKVVDKVVDKVAARVVVRVVAKVVAKEAPHGRTVRAEDPLLEAPPEVPPEARQETPPLAASP